MTKHTLNEIEHNQLLVQPKAFQPDDAIDLDQFHFGCTISSYMDYLEKQEAWGKGLEPINTTWTSQDDEERTFLEDT